MTTGILGYNSSNDRYGLLVMDLWKIEGFHCGECFDVWDSNTEQWIPTRIEMGYPDEWYLVGTPYRGADIEGLRARVQD